MIAWPRKKAGNFARKGAIQSRLFAMDHWYAVSKTRVDQQHQRENSHANAQHDCHNWMIQELVNVIGPFSEFLRKSGSKQ
jgi:hypothetical protein